MGMVLKRSILTKSYGQRDNVYTLFARNRKELLTRLITEMKSGFCIRIPKENELKPERKNELNDALN